MAAGLLELLLSGGVRAPRLRLGGEDTPAGGGLLDDVGQRIMAQQSQPQNGGILSMVGGSEPTRGQPMPAQWPAPLGRPTG